MPAQFFSMVWPLAVSILALAGLIVCLAALATLIATIFRVRYWMGKSGQTAEDEEGTSHPARESSPRTEAWSSQHSSVMETSSADGIHYIPVP